MSSKRTDTDALFDGVDVDALFEADDGKRPMNKDVAHVMAVNSIAMAKRYSDKFRRLFGMSLGRFMHPFFGFDVLKLDDFLKPPDGTSLKDAVLARWGEEAVALIETLIDPMKRGEQ